MAVNDVMLLILWTRYFLEAQGYEVCKNKVFQDNQSAMSLEKNGKRSSSHQMHHINIRYFFVTADRIQSKEVTVEYCPTDEMLADMFTKPLQGITFHHFCAAVLNFPDDGEFCPAMVLMAAPPQECVGKQARDMQQRTDQQVDRIGGKQADGRTSGQGYTV